MRVLREEGSKILGYVFECDEVGAIGRLGGESCGTIGAELGVFNALDRVGNCSGDCYWV